MLYLENTSKSTHFVSTWISSWSCEKKGLSKEELGKNEAILSFIEKSDILKSTSIMEDFNLFKLNFTMPFTFWKKAGQLQRYGLTTLD